MGDSQRSLPPLAFNTRDLKVHRIRKNVLGKIDESGPFSQPLPEASHDEESGPFSQALPGAFHVEAPFSGSFNVSLESKGKNVDVSLNVSGTPRCDEASSSGYSDLPKRSEGQVVDVNLNISGAPRCDEAPSFSSSSGPTKSRSDLIRRKRKDKVEDVNLDDLWIHIYELLGASHEKARSLGCFPWPNVPDLRELKVIVSFGSLLPIKDMHGAVKAILGRVNVATVAPLVVAHTLENLRASITNREDIWYLTKAMYDLALPLKTLSESPEGMQDVMQEATSLIVKGARVFFLLQGACRRDSSASPFNTELSEIKKELNTMQMHINNQITFRVCTFIEDQWRSHLSKVYPTHAESDPFSQPLLEASHDEAPFSGSLNVSMKSKGKNVDVSLYDEASSDLPKTSEDFDVNLNILGAPRCNEAPSSSYSSNGPTKSKSDLISNICKYIDKVEDFILDDLMKHMSELLKLREKGNHQEASILGHFPWPDFPGLQKLKEIVSFGTDPWIKDIHGLVKALLKQD